MSHANGQVRFSDGVVKHFEYNGTTDVCISVLYDLYEEMDKHWREGLWGECTCGKDEPVEIATDYGGGFFWEGRACRYCDVITLELQPDWTNWTDGKPDWWK